MIWATVAVRLLPHPANFAPIGAMALFCGTYLSGKKAPAVPLLALLVSDVFLGFHSTMIWVYGSFFMGVLMGKRLKNRVSALPVAGAAILFSVQFFLITNFGVWASSGMYPKTMMGLAQSYVMGIPFFRNSLAGDLFYSAVLFGGYAVWGRLNSVNSRSSAVRMYFFSRFLKIRT